MEKNATRRRGLWLAALVALVALVLGAGNTSALAQDFPAKPIRLIVPSSAGNVADLVARTLAGPMAKALGQPVVVENIPGAGGVTGTDRMVRSAKDGYTIGLASSNHAINPSIYKTMPFDSLKDIAPIMVVGTTPLALVVHPSVPAKGARELIALAKARPNELNYGSAGNGTVLHLAGVLFVSQAGVEITHVPYKGFAAMFSDLLGGQIQLGFAGVPSVAGHIKSGKLVALGVSTTVRSAILPDVPTLAEAGLPDYSFDAWLALIGPAGLPKPILDRLNAAAKVALASPEVQDIFAAQGIVIVGSTPEAATPFFRTELDKHAQLVKRSGATLE